MPTPEEKKCNKCADQILDDLKGRSLGIDSLDRDMLKEIRDEIRTTVKHYFLRGGN